MRHSNELGCKISLSGHHNQEEVELNRRHFFAASLPALLGWTVPTASAQEKPAPKPVTRRVKIQISFHKPSSSPGDSDDRTILLVTNEDVETYAAFTQMHPYRVDQAGGNTYTTEQDFGPWVRVRPRIGARGKITVDVKVEYANATSVAVTDVPFSVHSHTVTRTMTVENGQAVFLDDFAAGRQIQLTATILEAHQLEPNPLDSDQLA